MGSLDGDLEGSARAGGARVAPTNLASRKLHNRDVYFW